MKKHLSIILAICLAILLWNNFGQAVVPFPHNMLELFLGEEHTWTADQTFDEISQPPTVISADQEITPGFYLVDTANVSLHLSTPAIGDEWDISWAVTGASVFSNDAISFSIGGASYGNASGVTWLNNTDVGARVNIRAKSATSMFLVAEGTSSITLP